MAQWLRLRLEKRRTRARSPTGELRSYKLRSNEARTLLLPSPGAGTRVGAPGRKIPQDATKAQRGQVNKHWGEKTHCTFYPFPPLLNPPLPPAQSKHLVQITKPRSLTWLRRPSTSSPPSRVPPLQPQGLAALQQAGQRGHTPASRSAHVMLPLPGALIPHVHRAHPRALSSLSPADLPSERLCLTARPNMAVHAHLTVHPPTRGSVLQQRFIIARHSEMYLCDFFSPPH